MNQSDLLPLPLMPLPVLPYGQAEPRTPSRRGALLFMLLTLPALVTPFVAFTYGVSPLDVWVEMTKSGGPFSGQFPWLLLALATPFFTAIPLVLWRVILVARHRTTRGLRLAMWILATLCSLPALGTALAAISIMLQEESNSDMWPYPVGFGVLALGGVLAGVIARRNQRDQAITIAFYAGYLANAAYCLGGFRDSMGTGYYITAYVALVMVMDIGFAIVDVVRTGQGHSRAA